MLKLSIHKSRSDGYFFSNSYTSNRAHGLKPRKLLKFEPASPIRHHYHYNFVFINRLMPSYLYTINIKTLDASKDLIKILMIDTIILCGIDSNKSMLLNETYLNEIETRMKEISESKVPYFLVGGHFPVESLFSLILFFSKLI